MTPTHAVKRGRRYRYYVSAPLITGTRSDHCRGWRVPAGDIEGLVLDRLRAFFASEQEIGGTLACFDLDASTQRSAFTKAKQLAGSWTTLPSLELRGLIRSVIEQVKIQEDKIHIRLKRDAALSTLASDPRATHHRTELVPEPIDVSTEAKLRRAGKGIRLVVGGGMADPPDGRLVALMRDAHATREALLTGRDETIDAMARRIGVKRDYLSALMRVSYLAPDIVSALVAGSSPLGLTPARVFEACKDLPHDWRMQRKVLGISAQ